MKTTSRLYCLLLLAGVFSVQSCSPEFYSEGSGEYVSQTLKGASYTGPKLSNDDIGYNLALLYLFAVNGPMPSSSKFNKQPTTQSLLASSSNQLSFGSTYAPPKPSSLFTRDRFALMPGLELVRKGSKLSDGFGKDVTHLLYLEVPVYALYRHHLPDNKGELFGGVGPYFAYGLTGIFKSTFNGQTTKSSAFDTNKGGYKRFDAGLALTIGYQLPNSLRIRLGFDLGLTNIESGPSGPDDDKTYNRALSLNVGYPLGKIVEKFKKRKE